jgi:hypothetical protein
VTGLDHCQFSFLVSKPVFKLAREFPKLKSPEVQCAVVELVCVQGPVIRR